MTEISLNKDRIVKVTPTRLRRLSDRSLELFSEGYMMTVLSHGNYLDVALHWLGETRDFSQVRLFYTRT